MSACDNKVFKFHGNGSSRFIFDVDKSGVGDEEWCAEWRAFHGEVVNGQRCSSTEQGHSELREVGVMSRLPLLSGRTKECRRKSVVRKVHRFADELRLMVELGSGLAVIHFLERN